MLLLSIDEPLREVGGTQARRFINKLVPPGEVETLEEMRQQGMQEDEAGVANIDGIRPGDRGCGRCRLWWR